jgi:hypothetical protein
MTTPGNAVRLTIKLARQGDARAAGATFPVTAAVVFNAPLESTFAK